MRLISHHLVLLPLRARYQLDAIVEEFRPRLLDSVVWIFYDFVSLHQYARNEEQERLFRRALCDIFVMYSHDAVEVHRIETLTPESERARCVAAHGSKIFVYWKEEQKMMDVQISQLKSNETPYKERGWCRSEKEWASLRIKDGNSVPLPPDMFRAQMQQMIFTHREDSEKVFNLQAKVFLQKAASTTKLLIEDLDEDKIAVLFAALPFYTKLKELVVRGSPENAWKAALGVVESGACNVEIACENVRDEDAIAFAADLSKEKCNHLERLHVKCETIGELGRQALEQMMTRRRASLVISTADRSRGYVAQGIEPAVASATCVTLRILISKRRQPPRPAEAMAAGPAQAEDTSASGPLQSVPQHAEAGRPDTAQQTVSVHCLAGSSFELEVNSAETGWDVAVHIASRSGHPAETLVLTSGGCVIDQREPLLHQVQHGEITYVVQKLGAGRAARSWQRLLEEKTLSDTDVVALNETVSLTWKVNQSLQGIQLPSRLQSLTFGYEFNQSLEGIQLPSRLQSLTFGREFNQSLVGIQLPSSLQSLTFGAKFNQSLEGIQLPSSLQSLTFGNMFNQSPFRNMFNQSLEGIRLPSSLQSLTFGEEFNQSLEGIQLPSNLQSLTFGDKFNQSLDGIQLPSSLQSLTLGFEFSRSLEGFRLPSSLQSLTFGFEFNQSLKGIQLPSNLQSLTFGDEFNQSLKGIQLPSNLQSLTFGDEFNQSLVGIQLPSSLQSLTFGYEFNQSLEGIQLPSSLQSLTFGALFNQSLEGIQLPSSLQSLTFGALFNQSLEGIQLPSNLQSLTFGDELPSSLQSLTFGYEFNQSLEGIQLPSNLQSLTFGDEFNQSLVGIQLPSSLQSLTFGWKFNQSLEGIQLPSSLQSLTFGFEFNQSLAGIQLPSSLQSLTFGDKFNQSLEGIQLPSSLQSLTFGKYFNQSLEDIQLPSNLQSLTFGIEFNQSLDGIQLPSSLQSLTFGYHFNQSLEGIQLPSSLKSFTSRMFSVGSL